MLLTFSGRGAVLASSSLPFSALGPACSAGSSFGFIPWRGSLSATRSISAPWLASLPVCRLVPGCDCYGRSGASPAKPPSLPARKLAGRAFSAVSTPGCQGCDD